MRKIMTIVAGVLISTVVFAGGTGENSASASGVAVLRNGESMFKLIYKSAKVSDVRISIADSRNRLVYTETVRQVDGFLRPYNFSTLAEGEYTLTIVDESGKKVEKIDYRHGHVSKLVNVKRMGEDGKYLLTAAGKGAERITVNIFDASDALLYNESKAIIGDFAQVYNLSKIDGALTFEIIHQNGDAKRIKY